VISGLYEASVLAQLGEHPTALNAAARIHQAAFAALPRERRTHHLVDTAGSALVAPASSNTINKWAAGISDTLALGLITEAIGKRLPIAALPYLNKSQAAHPAFPRSVDVLNDAGVHVLLGDAGYEPHGPGQSRPEEFPWDLGLDAVAAMMTAQP
jgi:alpha-D-ribose 1-methylphosphonate 5-triphosphate synthase subunit PhnH